MTELFGFFCKFLSILTVISLIRPIIIGNIVQNQGLHRLFALLKEALLAFDNGFGHPQQRLSLVSGNCGDCNWHRTGNVLILAASLVAFGRAARRDDASSDFPLGAAPARRRQGAIQRRTRVCSLCLT